MRDSSVQYSFGSFLQDKKLFIGATIILAIVLSCILTILTVSLGGIILIDLLVLLGAMAYLVLEYLRDASFWRTLTEATDMLESSAYFADLVKEPSTLQGQIAYETTTAIAQASNAELLKLQRSQRDYSRYVELWVHEAKTPLAAAQLATRRMQGQDAHVLNLELERIGDLINQSLFASRFESLDRDYLIREVSLVDVVKDACKSHMHYLISLNVALEFVIDESIKVFTDKTWLEFIISQIVINSAKYEAKTITFMAIPPESESAEAHTVLEIRDNGCGIPAGDVPRVFDRGFTGEVGRAHGSATGMGLYLVACMCASMGLSITLGSEEGVGTRVLISFPHDRRRMHMTVASASLVVPSEHNLKRGEDDSQFSNLTNT